MVKCTEINLHRNQHTAQTILRVPADLTSRAGRSARGKNEQKTHDDSTLIIQSPKLKHNNDKEPPTNEIEESCVPEKVHSEIITIDGSIIEGNLTQKDGSKRNEWYWYNILFWISNEI